MSEDRVDQQQITLAKKFSNDFFTALKEGKTYEFHDEAIEVLRKTLAPEVQKQVYQNLKDQYGDYQSLEYIETWKSSGEQAMTIIRLKGTFDENKDKPEIRVVLNEENKIAGFWVKPWVYKLR